MKDRVHSSAGLPAGEQLLERKGWNQQEPRTSIFISFGGRGAVAQLAGNYQVRLNSSLYE